MNKNTLLLFIFGLVVFTAGILTFIYYSNDHIECENTTENSIGHNGEKISTEEHTCKERFNF